MESQRQYLLVVTKGPNPGEAYVLQYAVCSIGRTTDNAIVIDSTKISRHHAQLKPVAGGMAIEDLNSTNGTWVNGRRINGVQTLAHGDEIDLAGHITMRFEIEDTAKTERIVPAANVPTQAVNIPPAHTPPATPPPPNGEQVDATPDWLKDDVEEEKPARSRWFYVLLALLVILILACIAVAVYLWFAPVEFWIKLFDLFNIPLP